MLLGDNTPLPATTTYTTTSPRCFKNKSTWRRRCGVSVPPPTPTQSLLAGVIDSDVRLQCTFPVACQPDAGWQIGPPLRPYSSMFDSSCMVGRLEGWQWCWRTHVGVGGRWPYLLSACKSPPYPPPPPPLPTPAVLLQSLLQGECSCLGQLASI